MFIVMTMLLCDQLSTFNTQQAV